MLWFCGGHGACLTGSGEAGHIERAVLAWFARYLKRNTAVATGPRFEWLADDARWRSAPDYPLVKRGSLRAITGQKTLPIAPTSPSGSLIAATPAANAVEVALPAATGNAHVIGEPTLKLTYSGTAVPAQTHVYAQLVDGTGHVVGNQATPIAVTLDGAQHTMQRPLEAIASEAVAGLDLQAPDHAGDDALHAAALGRGGQLREHRDRAADRRVGARAGGPAAQRRGVHETRPVRDGARGTPLRAPAGQRSKTSSGSTADTSAFGASTSSDMRSSAATLIST